MAAIPYYLWICLLVAFVCTAVREDDPEKTRRRTIRLFLTISVGILLFAVVVQVLCTTLLP